MNCSSHNLNDVISQSGVLCSFKRLSVRKHKQLWASFTKQGKFKTAPMGGNFCG